MISKVDVVASLLKDKNCDTPVMPSASVFSPTNIALIKYWGKRNQELNLPVTSSLSVSLNQKGTFTELSIIDSDHDVVYLNDNEITEDTEFYQRIVAFLNLIPRRNKFFMIKTRSTIPTAAGLASSASGFAALTTALDKLLGWKLTLTELSILARLGSGSACRSLWHGFVEWQEGKDEDGMDSYGQPLPYAWPELRVGLLIFSEQTKPIGSRVAMQTTVETSPFYPLWPSKVANDLVSIKKAIVAKQFDNLGFIAESNALAMHATMLTAWPPINYSLPETLTTMKTVWSLRRDGIPVYFTQDAGPNLKLLFLEENTNDIARVFPEMEIVEPFTRRPAA